MKKEVIKPFDLAKAKAGAKLKTRAGLPVEIFKWDARGDYPIRGIIIDENEDTSDCWTSGGSSYTSGNVCPTNLVIVEEVEESEFWSDCKDNTFDGFLINNGYSISRFTKIPNVKFHRNIFANRRQAVSALAMSRISQIMANDIKNFGGPITDIEWGSDTTKYVIYRNGYNVDTTRATSMYHFLAFHTEEQRDLFLKKYDHLVRDYLMIL